MHSAKSKISELQRQIGELKAERDAAQAETDVVRQRGREFVGHLKGEVATKMRETGVQRTREAMTALYTNIKTRIQKQLQETEVYDTPVVSYSGEEILSLTKEAIKEATAARERDIMKEMRRRSS
eukprot:TRINITY_DN11614_c0_g1_i1.p1 TRINITY_DN11614_c0_g1~~TRINITY_DN11614_c0_g1_i1.p1  ORF type:complete len:125 (+),score=21.94 TRINITY_DN11614_c0_g1_i1:37-411(+)